MTGDQAAHTATRCDSLGGLGIAAPPTFANNVRRHLLVYFPLQLSEHEVQLQSLGRRGTNNAHAAESVMATMLAVDLAICQLVMQLVGKQTGGGMAAVRSAQTPKKMKGAGRPVTAPESLGWWEPVAEYVVDICSDAEAVSALCGSGEHLAVNPRDSAQALVRTAMAVMAAAPARTSAVWAALTILFKTCDAHSPLAVTLVELFDAHATSIPSEHHRSWLLGLFRVLWERYRKAASPVDSAAGRAILMALLNFARRRAEPAATPQVLLPLPVVAGGPIDPLDALQPAYVRFFVWQKRGRRLSNSGMPVGSPARPAEPSEQLGPFIVLGRDGDDAACRQALDLLFFYRAISPALLHGAIKCCRAMPRQPQLAGYLIGVLGARRAPPLPLVDCCTALLSLVCPEPSGAASSGFDGASFVKQNIPQIQRNTSCHGSSEGSGRPC